MLTSNSRAFALIDVLFATALLSIVSVGITLSAITVSKTSAVILRKSLAVELANNKLEELAALDPKILNDTYDTLELGLIADRHEFVRQVDVTTNADGGRTVSVTVNSSMNESTTVTHLFALWGNS